MRRRALLTYVVLVVLLVGSVAFALLAGEGTLADGDLRRVFLDLRATRAAAAFIVGAALATAGLVVQGLFRNPLVSPSILGTTAGASFGGQAALLSLYFASGKTHTALLAGVLSPDLVLPVGCLAGAVLALAVVMAFDRKDQGTLTLILTGFVLS